MLEKKNWVTEKTNAFEDSSVECHSWERIDEQEIIGQ